MQIRDLTLKTKLVGSFSIVIALLIIVSLVGFVALMQASSGFRQYREMARDSNLTAHLQADMLMMRMNVKDYIITGSEKDLEQYGHYLAKMHQYLEASKREIQHPDRAEKITFIDREVAEYQHAFDQVIAFKKQRNHLLYDVLGVDGRKMEKNLTAIMTSADRDQDIEAAFHAGLALRNLLLARLYVTKFIDSYLPADAQRVEKEFGQLEHEIEKLDEHLQNPERRRLLKAVSDADHEYHGAFRELVNLIERRNHLIDSTLDRIGPEIAESVESVKGSIKRVQDEIGPRLQATNARAELIIVAVSLLALLVGVALVVFITRSVAVQLGGDPSQIATVARKIAQGNLSIRFNGSANENATGVYGDMKTMTANLKQMFGDINQGVATLTNSASDLSLISGQMANGIQDVSQKAETVSAAAEEMNTNMVSVAAAMEQSTTNTNMVASSSEEMSATIGEIAQNAERARNISDQAAVKAADASNRMDQLGGSAKAIGKVVETITEISEQVNLLALNATIEAARAGSAGKGFAVVANEIKELARQTADASCDIKAKIEGIQGNTSSTVEQISAITLVINEVNEVVGTIATAVEQQSAATREIATNVSQASQGIQEVNDNVSHSSSVSEEISNDIASVNLAMNEMSTNSGQVQHRARELARLSENLKQMTDQFRI